MTGLTVRLVDGLRIRRVEFVVHGIFVVAEDEDDFLRLAGFQIHFDVVRAVRRPAVRDGVEGFAVFHRRRVVPTAIGAEKRVALRVETGEFLRAGEIREMVAPLAILGLVVDDAVHDLNLAGAEIALEVGGVVLGIPKAELDAGKNAKASPAGCGGWSPRTSRFRAFHRAARNKQVCASIFLQVEPIVV